MLYMPPDEQFQNTEVKAKNLRKKLKLLKALNCGENLRMSLKLLTHSDKCVEVLNFILHQTRHTDLLTTVLTNL